MYIQLTQRCNMSCPHCGFSCTYKGKDMTMETYRKVLKVAEDSGSYVALGGGEPTIHPMFLDMLGLAVIAQVDSVWLATNGSQTEIALRLAYLAKSGLIGCALSLDEWHDPIDPKVVKAFTKKDGEHDNSNDKREIRRVTTIHNAGRAKKNHIGKIPGCFCDDIFITPDGYIHPCGCSAGLKMDFGTVDKYDFPDNYSPGSCAKSRKFWDDELEGR